MIRLYAPPRPTPRQLELAAAVDRLTSANGRPPSWRELAEALEIGTRTARDLGYRCRVKGIVTLTDGKARSIAVTPHYREQESRA